MTDVSATTSTDAEIAQRLGYIHQTLELIALLLAVIALNQGGLGVIVGGSAILLLVMNAIDRALD